MNNKHKARVADSFGAVSDSYDNDARLQRLVAGRLAGRIDNLPKSPKILELGCGTGFLAQSLRHNIQGGQWLLSDIAPSMVMNCRQTLENPADTFFISMDAERPALLGEFDLICSSLVFQWLDDIDGCLRRLTRLLAPEGQIAFSTLTRGTLDEWCHAYNELGLAAATPEYPDVATLASMLDGTMMVEDEKIIQTYASAHAFVSTLKAIGAHTPPPGKKPLAAGTLRRVLRYFDDGEVNMTYQVAYGFYKAKS